MAPRPRRLPHCPPHCPPLGRACASRPDAPDRYPELDCLAGLLPPATVAAVRARAAAVGVGADRVLPTAGHMSEEAYLKALGVSLGVAFEPLDDTLRARCPVGDDALIESAATGMLQLVDGDDLAVVVAPRGLAVRRLIALLKDKPALAGRFRFTTAERLNRFVLRHAGGSIAARATDRLRETYPELSAGPRPPHALSIPHALLALGVIAGSIAAPIVALQVLATTLAVLFLAWLGLRFAAAFIAAPSPPPVAIADDALPVYSIIAALYREAASVDGLLHAIERLDYPPEKLDVIVALEADDRETRAAIAARRTRVPISVITVPEGGPRTKPKALNVALPFARGSFTVIYDAEDRPEPDQLRRALQAFGKKAIRTATSSPACRRGCASTTPPTAGWRAISPPNTPASSMPSCRGWRSGICRCRLAARPITSTPRRCARSAPGIPTTSPRTPTSACGWRASAIAPP